MVHDTTSTSQRNHMVSSTNYTLIFSLTKVPGGRLKEAAKCVVRYFVGLNQISSNQLTATIDPRWLFQAKWCIALVV